MKLLFISDIHGITKNLGCIDNIIINKNIDKLIVLGDLYSNYSDNLEVNQFLLKFKDKLICVKGNCDSNINIEGIEMVSTIKKIEIDSINIYITHGDRYNYENNNLLKNSILVYGHKHYPFIKKKDDITYICVGSISLPRNNSDPTYMIYENNKFIIYNIDGDVIDGIEV